MVAPMYDYSPQYDSNNELGGGIHCLGFCFSGFRYLAVAFIVYHSGSSCRLAIGVSW